MVSLPGRVDLGPRSIALAYVVFGGLWIAFSDRALDIVAMNQQQYQQLQTVKGWLFVLISGVLIYTLVSRSRATIAEKNDRLEHAVREASILHRILRHNLRNMCNVIQGYTAMLDDPDIRESLEEDCIEVIRNHTQELIDISEKSRHLRSTIFEDEVDPSPVEVVEMVETRVDRLQRNHPEATITTDLPNESWALAVDELEVAIGELLENAVEHDVTDEPSIDVTVEQRDETVEIRIMDAGPGIPETERAVLENAIEEPLEHSTGLGLWIARTIVDEFDGTLAIEERADGTVVRVRLTAADRPADHDEEAPEATEVAALSLRSV